MNSMDFYIGERVICSENGVVGDIVKFYKPTASEEQIMVRTLDGRKYHAPVRTWKPYQFGFTTDQLCLDEFAMIGLDLAHGKDMTGSLLNPYGEYVIKFAENLGKRIKGKEKNDDSSRSSGLLSILSRV